MNAQRGFARLMVVGCVTVAAAGASRAQITTQVNLDAWGNPAFGEAHSFALSADGRFAAFESHADSLVPGDTNGFADIFVRDRLLGTTTRVSVATGGGQASGGNSARPAISADGRYVAFDSFAANLVAGDTNGRLDVFLHDRQTGVTTRESVSSAAGQGDGDSSSVSISDDGRMLAFVSAATNLVSGDTNGAFDVFVRDRQSGLTARASVSSSGVQGNAGSQGAPAISGDGASVVFTSAASNLVSGDTNAAIDVFVRDVFLPATTRVSVGTGGVQADANSYGGCPSRNGRLITFGSSATNLVAGDVNGLEDVFVHDRTAGVTRRLSQRWDGVGANGISGRSVLSADGRYVAYWSRASNLVDGDTNGVGDIFLTYVASGRTLRASVDDNGAQGDIESDFVELSGNGRVVAFNSRATNLVVPPHSGPSLDLFAHEWEARAAPVVTWRASEGQMGEQGNVFSQVAVLSADGRWVLFQSRANTLVPSDTNGKDDAFLRDRQTGEVVRVSVSSTGAQGDGNCFTGYGLSGDARYVVFPSEATNMVAGDTNGVIDVFWRDLALGVTTRASVDSSGAQANGLSNIGRVSDDGRWVAFSSTATNLIVGDTNGQFDTFVRDMTSGTVTRVSVSSAGVQGNGATSLAGFSPDARFVLMESSATNLVTPDANGVADVFLRDRVTGLTTRESVGAGAAEANGESTQSWMSSDARFIAFSSLASNLVAGDTNGSRDVFLRDRVAGTTVRVNLDTNGVQTPSGFTYASGISGDGRRILFYTMAPLAPDDTDVITDGYEHDAWFGGVRLVSIGPGGQHGAGACLRPRISRDGGVWAFEDPSWDYPGDTNNAADIYVRDRQPQPTAYCTAGVSTNGCRASISSTGTPSVAQSSGFVLRATSVEGQRNGIFFYSIGGPLASPWGLGSSFLCVGSPRQRMAASSSGGTMGQCDGVLSIDWRSFLTANPAALGMPLRVGERIWVQAWYRDPAAPSGTNLSDALTFVVHP